MKTHYNITNGRGAQSGFVRAGVRSGALLVLMSSVVISMHATTPTAAEVPATATAQPVAVDAEAALRERASLDPTKLAARADAIKARRKQATDVAALEDSETRALRERTQRALANTFTEDERENILAEYLAIQHAVYAKKALDAKINSKAAGSK